jgi:tryptophanyl-tRNA synthetase
MATRVLSGMQPSGRLHLGNLLGALENFVRLQTEHECFYFIADWHALTTNFEDTSKIRFYTREMLIDWLAAGLDPARSTLFIQSHVPQHAVLYLLLSMITPVPWLERNPTYKEKQENLDGRDLSTHGFLGYPVLQAADILLYKGNLVPVGIDQLPHLELTREITRRFNGLYKAIFPEPQALLTEIPKVPGTDGRKMSKSYNNTINLSDTEREVRAKLKTMVTDPARVRRTDKGNPDVCPVFTLHKSVSSQDVIDRVNRECRTAEIGCIDCKKLAADAIVSRLTPIWEKRHQFEQQPRLVDEVLASGVQRASAVAAQTILEVNDAMRI